MHPLDLVGSSHAQIDVTAASPAVAGLDDREGNLGGAADHMAQDSTADSAHDVESVDLIREFYLTRLGESAVEPSAKAVRRGCSPAKSDAMPASFDTNSPEQELPTQRSPFSIDKSMLASLGTINRQLEQYYRQVNESGSCGIWSSEDSLSRIYLDTTDHSWPSPSELLGVHGTSSDLSEALHALDRRDDLCRKILAVQHCSLLAMGRNAGRESDLISRSMISSPDTLHSESVSSDADELRRLRRMVELYKSELSRLYEH